MISVLLRTRQRTGAGSCLRKDDVRTLQLLPSSQLKEPYLVVLSYVLINLGWDEWVDGGVGG